MTHVRVVPAAAVWAVLLLCVPGALGNQRVLRDPPGDNVCTAQGDIRKVVVGHEGDLLKHVIVMRRAGGRGIGFHIQTGRGLRNRHDVFDEGIYHWRTRETTDDVTSRRKGRRITFLFSPDAIGDPSRYRWRAFGGACGEVATDLAPNKGFKLHNLLAPDGGGSAPPGGKKPSKGCAKPPSTTKSRTACFRFSSKRRGVHHQCKLTGERVPKRLKRWRRCSSPKRYRGLKPGRKVFRVRAVSGGRRGKPDRYVWTVLP